MTSVEMKKVMKPIVKQCLREMLLEEGLLSNLIGEVLRGQQRTSINESMRREPPEEKPKSKTTTQDERKKLIDKIGKGAYENIFEGVSPMTTTGDPEAEGDSGIDLSMLSTVPGLKRINRG